jgi:hypothetical protein
LQKKSAAQNQRSVKMPLVKSASKSAIGKNIKAEESAGKGKKQSIAIALTVARKAGAKIPRKGKK